MNVGPGSRLLHYEIVDKVGEGGMGVVWKAHDTTLGRDVAIKVLPDLFAGDPDRLARFEREARVLASLNHPGIAGIYGLHATPGSPGRGEAHDLRFLVMEFVEGEDLEGRIGTGPTDLETVLDIGRQLCAALGAAHDSGIVHRDLKPANVRIAPDGSVKVLDFGLAKALAPDPASGTPDPGLSPTLTSAGTLAGTILGTAGYMSPEQARGRAADRRADVWAFGVVLYELLTGRRLFEGETVSDSLAAVLRKEPDWDALPAATPAPLRRLLKRCLAKSPSRRLHDIADAALEIEDAMAGVEEGPIVEAAPVPAAASRWLPWSVAVLAVLAAVWFALSGRDVAPDRSPPRRIETAIVPPPDAAIHGTAGLALSPDGTQLAFIGLDEAGVGQLWLRSLDNGDARPLEGTERAEEPFWSPDGRYLAFFAGRALRKVEPATGIVEVVAETARYTYGGAWAPDGSIVMAETFQETLVRIPPGGEPEPLTTKDDDGDSHQWPSLLPDGRHFLYLVRGYGREAKQGEIRIGSLDGTVSKPLFASNSNATWVAPGYVVWWAGGNLRAQRFDLERLELLDDPFAIAADVAFDPRDGLTAFTASADGLIVYQHGGQVRGSQLTWIERDGTLVGTVGPASSFYYPSLSPDGRFIAVDQSDETNRGNIWVYDAVRGTGTPLTSFAEDDSDPEWSPDGKQIAFFSQHGGENSVVYTIAARGGAEPRLLLRDPETGFEPLHWFGDRMLVSRGTARHWVEAALTIYDPADGSLTPFPTPDGSGYDARVSPDGRWVVYTSAETGMPEIYVQRFDDSGERWRVSTDGGSMPQWNRRGGELFYMSQNNELMAVSVRTAGEFSFERPRPLFRVDIFDSTARQYDTLDGQRFLVNVNARPDAATPLTVVQGWTAER